MDTSNLKNRLDGKIRGVTADTPNPAEEGIHIMNKTTTAMTAAKSDYVALKTNAFDVINANLKQQPLSYALFDIIKSPSGGATAFTVPGLAGDEIAKEITGIILDFDMPRAYWETPDPVEGTPPVCYSRDSIMSHEGKPCSRCAFNDFGSKGNGETNAKACKESVAIYMLRPDSIMPIIVRVPVTSKLIFQRFMMRLSGSLIPSYGVVTKITLEKATNKAGQPYALYNFEVVRKLESEEAEAAQAFGLQFREILSAADEPDVDVAV
jgi:hypothetical protein